MTATIFSITGARARFVAVAGKPLLRDGSLLYGTSGLQQRMQSLADSLAKWLDEGGELQGVA